MRLSRRQLAKPIADAVSKIGRGEGDNESSSTSLRCSRRGFLKASGAGIALAPFASLGTAVRVASNNPFIHFGMSSISEVNRQGFISLVHTANHFLVDFKYGYLGNAKQRALHIDDLLSGINRFDESAEFDESMRDFLDPANLQKVVYFFNPAQEITDTFILGESESDQIEYRRRLDDASQIEEKNRREFMNDPTVRSFILKDYSRRGVLSFLETCEYHSSGLRYKGVDAKASYLFDEIKYNNGEVYESLLRIVRTTTKIQIRLPATEFSQLVHEKFGSKYQVLKKVSDVHGASNIPRVSLELENENVETNSTNRLDDKNAETNSTNELDRKPDELNIPQESFALSIPMKFECIERLRAAIIAYELAKITK